MARLQPSQLSAALSFIVGAALIVAACAPAAPPTATAAPKPAAAPAATNPAAPPAATKPAPATAAPTSAAPAATKPAEKPAQAPTSAPAATKPAVESAKPAAAKPGQVKLSFLGNQNPEQAQAWSAILAEYQKTNPNVTVEWEFVPFAQLFPKIQANTAARAPMDIIQADGPVVWNYAYNKAIVPLDDTFAKDYVDKQWSATSLVTAYFRGKFYAPPMMESCSLMWFNQEMTDKAGVKPPQKLSESWTMDQAVEAWQKTNNPPSVYGVRWGQGTTYADYEHGIFRRSAAEKGSPAYKGIADDGVTLTGFFDSPQAIQGHQFMQDIYQKYKVSPSEPIPDIFFNRKSVFYIAPDNAIGVVKRLHPDGNFKLAVTGIPYFKGGSQVCHTDSWHLAVGANSQNPKEAAEFIKFATGPVGAKIWYDVLRQLPAHLSLVNTLPEYQSYPQSLVAEQFRAAGVPRIQTPGYNEYFSLSLDAYTNMITGPGANVGDIARQFAQRMNTALARYKGWQTG